MTFCPHCFSERIRNNTCVDCKKNVTQVEMITNALGPGMVLRKQFVIGSVLGAGGFGITYLAYDRMLKQKLAIKEYMPKKLATRDHSGVRVIPLSEEHEPAFMKGKQQFVEEARTIVKFRHENIVPIHTCFESNNTAYFIMPYVKGKTLLRMVLQRGGLPERELAEIFDAVLNGLEAVHAKHVWHRDIKPANIYIPDASDEKPFLLDFGAARQAVRSNDPMSILLTHGYSPLEQYSSTGKQGAHTDIYGVAASMYSCLRAKIVDGRLVPPLSAEERANGAILEDIRTAAKVRIKEGTAMAIMKGLEMDPMARPTSISAFRQLLSGGNPGESEAPFAKPIPSSAMHYELICLAGPHEGERFPLDERELVIGRAIGDVSLWIDSQIVSKRHCKLSLVNGVVFLEDLGSLNGTFMTETMRLGPHKITLLYPGDTFNVAGSAIFELQEVPGPAPGIVLIEDMPEKVENEMEEGPVVTLERHQDKPFDFLAFIKHLSSWKGEYGWGEFWAAVGIACCLFFVGLLFFSGHRLKGAIIIFFYGLVVLVNSFAKRVRNALKST